MQCVKTVSEDTFVLTMDKFAWGRYRIQLSKMFETSVSTMIKLSPYSMKIFTTNHLCTRMQRCQHFKTLGKETLVSTMDKSACGHDG